MRVLLLVILFIITVCAECQTRQVVKFDQNLMFKDNLDIDDMSVADLAIKGHLNWDELRLLLREMSGVQNLDLSEANINFSTDNDAMDNYLPSSFFSTIDEGFISSNLRSLILPNSLKGINNHAFFECANLDTIYIPASVDFIGTYAMNGFGGSILVDPGNNQYMCNEGILQDKLQTQILYVPKDTHTLLISKNVSKFDFSLLQGDDVDVVVDQESSHFKMIDGIIYNRSITSLLFCPRNFNGNVSIPNTVENIASDAFNGCDKITDISIPISVYNIGNSAFKGCSQLKTFSLPIHLSELEDGTFEGCSMLEKIIMPHSLLRIGSNVFKDCVSLVDISIPNGVQMLNSSVFENCSGLVQFQLPSSVLKIGNSAFRGCSKLKEFQANNSLVEIDNFVFYGCSSLESFDVPASVEKIGGGVFNNCDKLKSISVNSQKPIDICKLSENLFENVDIENLRLFVPMGDVNLYRSDSNWSAITHISESESGDEDASAKILNLKQISDEIKLYPNPTSDGFYIEGLSSNGSLSIFDINGRLLMNQDVSNNEYISVNYLLQGTYMVRIKIEDCISEHKLIKKASLNHFK